MSFHEAIGEFRQQYSEQPPEHLEIALRARFQQRRQRQRARWWGVCAMAATAVVLIVWMISPPRHQSGVKRPASAVQHPPEQIATVREEPVRPKSPLVRRAVKPHRAAVVPEENVDMGTEFVAIPYAEPLSPSEQVDVYRVELPRVTLAHFGLPMRPGALDSTVKADLAVGSDGVARAIRFVQ